MVEILDERLHIYTEEEIGKQLEGAVLVGISAITSYQIVNGLRFARSVRRLAPHIPIVWGGWHPTLMPMETLRHPLVDAVAIGQGEEILPQLAQRARDRLPFKGVPNVLYKDTGGQVVINPRIEMARYPVYGSPAGGYTAVDLERYIHPQWGHRRVVGYEPAAAAHTAVLFVPLERCINGTGTAFRPRPSRGISHGFGMNTALMRCISLTIIFFSMCAGPHDSQRA